jgi:hypothetical protein
VKYRNSRKLFRLKVATTLRLPSVIGLDGFDGFGRVTRPVTRIWKAPVATSSIVWLARALSHADSPFTGSSSIE